jgi:hypothetical protein
MGGEWLGNQGLEWLFKKRGNRAGGKTVKVQRGEPAWISTTRINAKTFQEPLWKLAEAMAQSGQTRGSELLAWSRIHRGGDPYDDPASNRDVQPAFLPERR